jgi:hypothetical protein
MSEALYALAGAFLGVVGTVLTEALRSRREDRTAWRRDLRSVCVEFAGEISRLRDLSYALRADPVEQRLRDAADESHTRARALLERLRLTSDSVATQQAARLLVHHAYHQWRSTQGGPGSFDAAQQGLDHWLERMHVEARRELGLRGDRVYTDPGTGLPIPGAPEATT